MSTTEVDQAKVTWTVEPFGPRAMVMIEGASSTAMMPLTADQAEAMGKRLLEVAKAIRPAGKGGK